VTVETVELDTGEHLIASGDEVLYRQITRHLVAADGRPGSHAFGPQGADQGKASFSRSSRVSAQASRDWHTANAKSPSLGVWAVSVDEVTKARTVAIDDSGTPLDPGQKRAPGHCFVDYRGRMKEAEKTVRAILLRAALEREEIPTEDQTDGLFNASLRSGR